MPQGNQENPASSPTKRGCCQWNGGNYTHREEYEPRGMKSLQYDYNEGQVKCILRRLNKGRKKESEVIGST